MFDTKAQQKLLGEAIDLSRKIKSNSESFKLNNDLKNRFRQISHKLQNYSDQVVHNQASPSQIPLEVRRCFVESLLLQIRYSKLLLKPTTGSYKSPIVDSYQCDRLNHTYQREKLCQLFNLPLNYLTKLDYKLTEIDANILKQKRIIKALLAEFNHGATPIDILNLFQQLFGEIPLPKLSIDCLATEMQIIFIIHYHDNHLSDKSLWQKLYKNEQEAITHFLKKISTFSWQQFTHFPSFGYIEASKINPQLIVRLIQKTSYSKVEIIRAIASSTSIISQEKFEAFLLHDIWGHYWQSLLTNFSNSYQYLSQANRELTINSTIQIQERSVKLQQLFKHKNKGVYLNKPLARKFFHSLAQERLSHLGTHLIAEMLADINEYKWLSQNQQRQDLLPSSSCLKDFPSKLDLLLQDLDFLYKPIFQPLIQLNQANLVAELAQKLEIKADNSLQQAIAQLNLVFLTEYITNYQPLINNLKKQLEFSKFLLNILYLQNLLNHIYNSQSHLNNLLPYQDLLIIFTAKYYQNKPHIPSLNANIAKYFLPCYSLLSRY
ncbi:MAG: hypothetical protein AAFQ80_02765 [Cyanobacteria bacterium J06621_8]